MFDIKQRYLEENKPLGTAGSLSLLPTRLKESFIVINGDIMTRVNYLHLLDYHEQQNFKATICVREYKQHIPYGVVKINKNKLLAFEEKPSHSYFVNTGIYGWEHKKRLE